MSAPVQPLRVVLADDHPFYRGGLARFLRANGITVAAEAANGEAAVKAVRETTPDVVVMDLNMPGVSGVEATRRLTEAAPETRVLMLTVSANEADLADAILAGACGYVLKDRPVRDVIDAIRAAAGGGAPISPELAMPLLRRLWGPARDGVDVRDASLDDGERALIALVTEGRADPQIARELGIEAPEVGERASAILGKLQLEQRMEAARRAALKRLS